MPYPGCATFLPAPWLAEAILTVMSRDPFHLIIAAKAAAATFDAMHNNNPAYTTTANEILKDFILWAWGAKQGRVSHIVYNIKPDDPDLSAFHVRRNQDCIDPQVLPPPVVAAPPAPIGPPPNFDNDVILQQLTHSINVKRRKQRPTTNLSNDSSNIP